MRGCVGFLRDIFLREIRSTQVNSTSVHFRVVGYLFLPMKGPLVISSFYLSPYNFRMFFPRCRETYNENCLMQWFPNFLMQQPFNKVPHVVLASTIKLNLLLLHNCSFPTVMNQNVNNFGDRHLSRGLCLMC